MLVFTNDHHFNDNVKIVIDDINNKLTEIIFKDTVISSASDIDSFIDKIQLLFRFTGIDCVGYLYLYISLVFNELTHLFFYNSNQFYKPGELTKVNGLQVTPAQYESFINTIYNTPLEFNVKFVRIGTCGCNMGYCSAITSCEIDGSDYKCYGDLMNLFGPDYPDSVMLEIKELNDLPSHIHNNHSCYSPKVPLNIDLQEGVTYLSWGYYR